MLKVTSYQLLVVGWDVEHCMTILRLQNFFTNTILLKPGTYIHTTTSFQYFKKTSVPGQIKEYWQKWLSGQE